MGEYDGEIGRGRQRGSGDDSSSSRESSKERPASSHRIASPAHTEDGDSRMQTIADDDTPPPSTRPIIRQALGFSADQPAQSINTYEAVPPTAPKTGFFLPGQEVSQPSQPKPATDKPKKPRIKRTDAYPGQQSRFRIQTYDPTPTAEPPTDRGSGPYASMYRGVSGPAKKSNRDDASTAANGDHPSSMPSSNTSNVSRTNPSDSRGSTVNRSQPPPPVASSRSRMQPAKTKSSQPDYPPPSQHSSYSQQQPPPSHYPLSASHSSTSSSYHGSSSLPPPASPPYYRNDYPPFSREQREREYQQAYGGPMAGYDAEDAHRRSKHPLRMVTVLIQDLRSGTVDHQLAEVKVPLRQCDVPEDGFWADSRDIAHQLQHGPSRIDGPARAYTLRGKYRQFILRVTADNQDEIMSANVGIQPDRTLDLVIEMLPPPGGPPLAPKIPTELLGPSYDDAQSNTMDVDPRSPQTVKDARKRPNSASFDDYDSQRPGPQPTSIPNKAPRHSYSQHYSPGSHSPRHASPHYPGPPNSNADSRGSNRRQSNQMEASSQQPPQYTFPPPLPPSRQSPVPPSPSDAPMRSLRPDQSDEGSISPEPDGEFIAAVDQLLQKDQASWTAFYKAKAGNKVADVLKQYEFVRQKCKALRGSTVPGFQQHITDEHIIQALKVEEKTYLYMCNKTMDLMMLYGKQGQFYEDPRIEDMINDTSPPEYGSNPYKRILHLLERIDQSWHNGKTEPRPRAQQSHSPTLPGPPGHQSSHSDSLAQRSRISKGFFAQ